jgi:hypothetical protein
VRRDARVFDFRATASVKEGKQRLTAIGADANDAIEKPVTSIPTAKKNRSPPATSFSDNAILESRHPGDRGFPIRRMPN